MLRVIEYAWGALGALVAAGTPVWLFVFLLRRVRRRSVARIKAALVYLLTVLLPVLYLAVLWGLADLANAFDARGSIWYGDAGIVAFGITGTLLASIGVLNILFWAALFFFGEAQAGSRGAT